MIDNILNNARARADACTAQRARAASMLDNAVAAEHAAIATLEFVLQLQSEGLDITQKDIAQKDGAMPSPVTTPNGTEKEYAEVG